MTEMTAIRDLGDARDDTDNHSATITVAESETANDGEVELTAEEVRQGRTGDNLRKILVISSIGAALLLAGAYLVFAR